MTGLLIKKYHVAILDNDESLISNAVSSLKAWYQDRMIIKTYKDSKSLFEAVSLNKAKNAPFDLTVLSPNEYAERLILQRSNPGMKILVCKNDTNVREETSKLLL